MKAVSDTAVRALMQSANGYARIYAAIRRSIVAANKRLLGSGFEGVTSLDVVRNSKGEPALGVMYTIAANGVTSLEIYEIHSGRSVKHILQALAFCN